MATPPAFFHALLRPAILQILRATGYHATRPAVLDALTDLAARYLLLLCQRTAAHAASNSDDLPANNEEDDDEEEEDFTVTDVRLALQDMGALGPERSVLEERRRGEEDLRGVDEFVAWFVTGQQMRELMEAGAADGEADATDYLAALKKKHNHAGGDAKFQGTILGRPADGHTPPQVLVEGGPVTTIAEWMALRSPDMLMLLHPSKRPPVDARAGRKRSAAAVVASEQEEDGEAATCCSSSGLSSPAASVMNVDHGDMMDIS